MQSNRESPNDWCGVAVRLWPRRHVCQAGLRHITLPGQSQAKRVDLNVQQYWPGPHQFDERLASDAVVEVTWTGYLEVKSPGIYQLALNAAGDSQLWIGERLILQCHSSEQTTTRSQSLELPFGVYPVRWQYRSEQPAGQLQLLWQGTWISMGADWRSLLESLGRRASKR